MTQALGRPVGCLGVWPRESGPLSWMWPIPSTSVWWDYNTGMHGLKFFYKNIFTVPACDSCFFMF